MARPVITMLLLQALAATVIFGIDGIKGVHRVCEQEKATVVFRPRRRLHARGLRLPFD
jgi:hypothetical protein